MSRAFFGRKRKQACVVGLDGVPCALLRALTGAGVMPQTAGIVSRGRLVPMTAALPEISAVSWSTFMTGKNPGEHGIFGFSDLRPGGYAIRFPSFGDLRTPTIWDRLGEKGLRSVVINQPATYPARVIPGALVSGFVALDMDRAVAPPRYLGALERMGYRVDIDAQRCRDDPRVLFSELTELLALRLAALDMFWESERWNLMQLVVTGTDRLHHFMWDAYEDNNHPYHEDFLAYYRRVDELIAHVFERCRESDTQERFFMLSDHGFCRAKIEVNINGVLRRAGFLELLPGAETLEGITEASSAFALDPARIYLNRAGRFPRGSVSDGQAPALLERLAELFAGLEYEGEPVIERVVTRAEAYSGQRAALGPDLLLVPHRGYDLKARPGADEPFAERRFQGMHTWDDAFFFSLGPEPVSAGGELNIVDAPAVIAGSLGVEI